MVAGDQPLLPVPLVREGIAGLHARPCFLEGKGIEPGVDRSVAIDLDLTRIL